ncbi:MAG: saccharopine dehydrogenase NADP-binding domain-containing protein [Chitinophagaceae bacterium]|nr:saccharopine dehydrogenase NADP-binding domain-containing protein [Chitinophagaceae bacterium]
MQAAKHIVLFGAGKSATVLIDYLKEISGGREWKVTVADASLSAAREKTGEHEWVKPMEVSVEDEAARRKLVKTADAVISLLPPALHFEVAQDCVHYKKHLLTASYVDANMAGLAKEVNKLDVLFLCEMGLDPGIDHMSAMQLIHRIHRKGGRIGSFVSHCGGLVAPESDDNPWHYKISWNPKNVVLAGKSGAVYRENGTVKTLKYEQLFSVCEEVEIGGIGRLAYYPNRDSLSYIPVYGLEEAATFVRTTLRHPEFCKGWNTIVELGLTDEKNTYQTDSMSVGAFLKAHFDKHKIPLSLDKGPLQKQFKFLGLNDDTLINKHECCSADVLQWIIEKKWALKEADRDMIVMLHEIGYELEGKQHTTRSQLVVKGEDSAHTAMAATVGLPLGIAATLLLDGKIKERGLHIPTVPGIYNPVLKMLGERGVVFKES